MFKAKGPPDAFGNREPEFRHLKDEPDRLARLNKVIDRLLERGDEAHAADDKERREEIETRAWNAKLEAYVQACGSKELDASALLLAYHGFEVGSSRRMLQTNERIREKLVPRPGLVHRNEKSKDRHEGAFALCSFWEADFLARSGNVSEARRFFEATLAYANDVDLFAEEIDPETGDALGNFPQGFTHLGVINAALSVRDSEERAHKLKS